jgi:glutathione S-transferase
VIASYQPDEHYSFIMPPTLTVFERAPDGGRGLTRDMAVRWALEEAGQSYSTHQISFQYLKGPQHKSAHPFGQIPLYQENKLNLFESGAIVLHIAETHKILLPDDANARSRVIAWMFAALSTLEAPIVERSNAYRFEREESWYEARMPRLNERVRYRLRDFSAYLGEKEWLEGEFGAGDVMVIAILRWLKGSELLEEHANLAAYVARGEARPAYKRAFEAQLALFTKASQGA